MDPAPLSRQGLPRALDDAGRGPGPPARHVARRPEDRRRRRLEADDDAAARGGRRPRVPFPLDRQGPVARPPARAAGHARRERRAGPDLLRAARGSSRHLVSSRVRGHPARASADDGPRRPAGPRRVPRRVRRDARHARGGPEARPHAGVRRCHRRAEHRGPLRAHGEAPRGKDRRPGLRRGSAPRHARRRLGPPREAVAVGALAGERPVASGAARPRPGVHALRRDRTRGGPAVGAAAHGVRRELPAGQGARLELARPRSEAARPGDAGGLGGPRAGPAGQARRRGDRARGVRDPAGAPRAHRRAPGARARCPPRRAPASLARVLPAAREAGRGLRHERLRRGERRAAARGRRPRPHRRARGGRRAASRRARVRALRRRARSACTCSTATTAS